MNNQFLSINDAAKYYDVSANTIRRIILKNANSKHVQKISIQGKHGFKYLISVQYLDSIYNKQEVKQIDKQIDRQNDDSIDRQIEGLNKQIDRQNDVIEKLTDTIKEQNKVIVSQSMQIHQLTSTASKMNAPEEEQYSFFEKLIISVLVIVILAVCFFMFLM